MQSNLRLYQYEILESLGEGKAVSTFRARDLLTGKEVVVKEFRSPPGTGGSLLHDLESSVRRTAGLMHPNLAPARKWIEGEREAYVVRDFIPGKTLRDLLKEYPQGLPFSTARDILLPVCEALCFLHELTGQAHNGLHPDNILIGEDGRVLISDLGSSAVSLPGRGNGGLEVEDYAYIAPERLAGEASSDPRADVYSLGALLFQMLTGRTPAEPGQNPAWFEETGVAKLLSASIKNSPQERYTGARGFWDDLKAALLPPQMSVLMEDTSAPIPRGDSHHVRVKVTNHGQARLRITEISASEEWVSKIAPARMDLGVGESQEVDLILNTTHLPAGKNESRITVRSNAFGAETASFPLSIDILAPSVKAVPPGLNFAKQAGKSPPQQIMVSRSDGRSIKARVEISEQARSWIHCAKVLDTGNAQMFNVTVDASGLPPGVHRGTITLKDADPFEVKSVQIPVVVMVEAPVVVPSPPPVETPQPTRGEEKAIPNAAPETPVAVESTPPPVSMPVEAASRPEVKPKEKVPAQQGGLLSRLKSLFRRGSPEKPGTSPAKKPKAAPPPIAEGAPRGSLMARLFARAIDTLTLVAISFAISTVLMKAWGFRFLPDPTGFLLLPFHMFKLSRQLGISNLLELYARTIGEFVTSPAWWVGLWISGVYYIFTTTLRGKTPGKSLMKLKVLHRDGGKITSRQSLLRWLGYHLSELTLGLGYLPALLRTRRGLHDRIGKSYVALEEKEQKSLPPQSGGPGTLSGRIDSPGHYNEVVKDILRQRTKNE